ncbi:hypothetical protein ACFW3E_15800, partial [Streptomyces sp. NPDC058861]
GGRARGAGGGARRTGCAPGGRGLRQVYLGAGGPAGRRAPDDWSFNPPVVDLFDPMLAGQEISQSDFEEQWAHARPVDSGK